MLWHMEAAARRSAERRHAWPTMTTDGGMSTQRERARFEAVRRRVFDEMAHLGSRWRLALMVPFQVIVIGVLAARDFPKERLAIQIAAFGVCVGSLHIAKKAGAAKNKVAHFVSALAIFVAIGNTGGLASPLILSAVPLMLGVSLNPELHGKRRAVLFLHLTAFGILAWLSQFMVCALSGPLAPRAQFASEEYLMLALASLALTAIAMHHMGRGVTAAYERIALELVERREELCDENEGRTRALEGIAARLAHEVKNPLAAIKGLSSHVARNADDPKVKERLSIVAAEADRLQAIVDGFLSFSRGLDELEVGPAKPFEIARELSLLLETRAEDAGVGIDVRGSRELVVNADGKKLRQALLNLVLNAMQASTKGGVVAIEVAKSCADGAAVVRIIDRGAGMAREVLERIEKPYFTTKEGGSGLGIAIARGIIEQHGGSLRFESTAGRGTTATITLPACALSHGQKRLPNPCRMAEKVAAQAAPTPAPASAPFAIGAASAEPEKA